jgi:hypothetical protein
MAHFPPVSAALPDLRVLPFQNQFDEYFLSNRVFFG